MSLEHNPARKQRRRREYGPTAQLVFTVNEFCDAHRISRTHLYSLWRKGIGPRFKLVGEKRLITVEAAADWRAQDGLEQSPDHIPGKRGSNRRGGEVA